MKLVKLSYMLEDVSSDQASGGVPTRLTAGLPLAKLL